MVVAMYSVCEEALSLSYLPELQDDELLCSYLARLAAFNGLSATRFYEYFVGKHGALPTVDLPTNAVALQLRLGVNSPFNSVDELIAQATVYPYHRVFLSPEREKAVSEALRYGCGRNPKATLGRLANRFGANPALRYCESCVEHDYESLGSPYWHRAHQLPGVSVCTHHNESLRVAGSEHHLVHRTKLILPPLGKNGVAAPPPDQRQWEFAALSAQLLLPGLAPPDPKERVGLYRNAAISQGFRTNGRIDFVRLAVAMQDFYDDFNSFYHRNRLLATSKTPLAWLRPLFCRPDRSCHPICHLLLIQFLFGSFENFLSGLSHQCGPHQSIDLKRNAIPPAVSNAGLIADATRSCRSIAAEIGVSVTTVVQLRRERGIAVKDRPKTMTVDKASKIVSAIQENLSMAEVAERCGVSVSTVYRQRRIHHLQTTDTKIGAFDVQRKARRAEWVTAVDANPEAGVSRVRSCRKATYTWLYRNDRAWLSTSCGSLRKLKSHPLKVDWRQRDLELCKKLRQYVSGLSCEEPRMRISRSLMLNYIGEAMARSNKDQLPRTFSLLMELEESVLENQIRRIDQTIMSALLNGQILKGWQIQRLCGIRRWTPFHTHHVLEKYSDKNLP